MNKKTISILQVLLFIFFILAVICHYQYCSIPDELSEEATYYEFGVTIEPAPEFSLYGVLIYYDFLNKEGYLTFEVAEGTKPHHLGFTTPRNLIITNIIIKNNSNFELKEGIDFLRENKSYNLTNKIDLDNFKRSIEDCKVLIKFEGELIPNAEFCIDFLGAGRVDAHKDEFFNFNIGDYYCSSPRNCLSSEWDRFSRYVYYWKTESKNVLAVARSDEKGSGVDLTWEIFRLRLEQSRSLLEEKQNWNQLRFLFLAVFIATLIDRVNKKKLK